MHYLKIFIISLLTSLFFGTQIKAEPNPIVPSKQQGSFYQTFRFQVNPTMPDGDKLTVIADVSGLASIPTNEGFIVYPTDDKGIVGIMVNYQNDIPCHSTPALFDLKVVNDTIEVVDGKAQPIMFRCLSTKSLPNLSISIKGNPKDRRGLNVVVGPRVL